MPVTTEQMYVVFQSIDATLKELLALSKSKRSGTAYVADDKDLDSTFGDELVKFNPRDYAGESIKGLHMSQCPPEALERLADAYAYFAKRNDESQAKTDKGVLKSTYDRRSEARARAWAARLRNGWTPPAPADGFPSDGVAVDDSDLAF